MLPGQFEDLLPLNEEINHLGKPLVLKTKIGEGYTGVVYEGELKSEEQWIRVAVKARKELDFPGARENFRQEAITLARFMELEEKYNKKIRVQGLKIAPLFWGKSEFKSSDREIDYIVMEFIEGVDLPELLQSKKKLPESHALIAAWQFFRVLDILHTEFNKVFIDLKLENLWWVDRDGPSAQLKVTDLGTLAEIKYTGQKEHDLLLGGIILCILLTGYSPRYNVYGLTENVEPIIKNYEMSSGTRQVLRRLLHRNPNQRYTNAADIVNELRMLSDFWFEDEMDLYETGLANQEEALKLDDQSGMEARELLQHARAAFHILSLRNPDFMPEDVDTALKTIDELLVKSDYLGIGIDLFRGGSWQKASEMFEQGKEWSSEPAILRRWAYLAKAMSGNKIPEDRLPDYREKAMQAVEWLNAEAWSSARQRINELAPLLNTVGTQSLLAECDLAENFKSAEDAKNREDYGRAAQCYQKAVESLAKLPANDQDFVQKVELGDLRAVQVEMERLERTRGHAGELIRQAGLAADKGQFDQVQQQLSQAYEADLSHPDLADSILQTAKMALDSRDLKSAESILAIGLRLSQIPNEIIMNWKAVQAIRPAQRALKERQYDAFVKYVRRAWSENPNGKQVTDITIGLLEEFEQIARQAKDTRLLDSAASLFDDAPGDEGVRAEDIRTISNQLRQAQDQKLRTTIDQQIAYIMALLHAEKPQHLSTFGEHTDLAKLQEYLDNRKQRLLEAHQLVLDVEKMNAYLKHRGEETRQLKARLEQEIEQTGTVVPKKSRLPQEEYQKRYAELQSRWKRIEPLRLLVDQGISQFSPALQRSIIAEIGSELVQLIPSAQILLTNNSSPSRDVQEIMDTAKRLWVRLGPQEWQALAAEAKDQIAKFEQDLQAARTAFEQGHLAEAAEQVDLLGQYYYDNAEWLELKSRVKDSLTFERWKELNKTALETNQDPFQLLDDLEMFAEKRIPEKYWQDGLSRRYLECLDAAVHQELGILVRNNSEQKFISLLSNWLKLEQILHQTGSHQKTGG